MEIHIEWERKNHHLAEKNFSTSTTNYHPEKDFKSTDHLNVSTRTDLRSETSKQIKQSQRNENKSRRRKKDFKKLKLLKTAEKLNEFVRELNFFYQSLSLSHSLKHFPSRSQILLDIGLFLSFLQDLEVREDYNKNSRSHWCSLPQWVKADSVIYRDTTCRSLNLIKHRLSHRIRQISVNFLLFQTKFF